MTHFLITDDNSEGYMLEDILSIIRKDIILRSSKILDDDREQAQQVLENNIKILGLLSESINLADSSTKILDKSFGPGRDGKPRIGTL